MLAPNAAARVGLSEPESDVDSTFYADARGEAAWDMLSLWTLIVAGVLLMLNSSLWPYFGLVGGGMYLYFAGRGIIVRLELDVSLRRSDGAVDRLAENVVFGSCVLNHLGIDSCGYHYYGHQGVIYFVAVGSAFPSTLLMSISLILLYFRYKKA